MAQWGRSSPLHLAAPTSPPRAVARTCMGVSGNTNPAGFCAEVLGCTTEDTIWSWPKIWPLKPSFSLLQVPGRLMTTLPVVGTHSASAYHRAAWRTLSTGPVCGVLWPSEGPGPCPWPPSCPHIPSWPHWTTGLLGTLSKTHGDFLHLCESWTLRSAFSFSQLHLCNCDPSLPRREASSLLVG